MTIAGTRSVTTGDVGFGPVRPHGDAADDASPTEFESGPVTVTARVEVVYDVTGG